MKFKQVSITRAGYELWPYSDLQLRLLVRGTNKIMSKVNRALSYQYPKDTKFTDLDEPTFKLNIDRVQDVLKVLKLVGCNLDKNDLTQE